MKAQLPIEQIDRIRYFELALSRKQLRRDDSEAGVRALIDPELNVRYVIKESDLLDRETLLATVN